MKSKGISKLIGLLLAASVTVSAVPLTFAACADASAASADDPSPKSYRVMDLSYTSPTNADDFKVNAGFGARIDYMSLGDQAFHSKNGFSVKPNSGSAGEKTDFTVDLSQLDSTVTYFNAVVGVDDLGPMWRLDGLGGSAQFFVIADGRTIGQSDVMYPGDMQSLSCDIPEGTKTLVLRSSNADGDNYMDYCDWAEPTLYTSRFAAGQVEKSVYSEDNDFGNKTVSAIGEVGVRFSAKEKFSSLKFNTIVSSEKVDCNIYKFTYSYERSIQNGTLTSVTAKKQADGTVEFPLNTALDAGEYLVVLDGVTKIKANGSQYGYYFLDGVPSRGLVNMSVTFVEPADSYFNVATEEPAVTYVGAATASEKARAKKMYNSYLTDLETFPSSVKIGDDMYNGFPAPDFTEVKRESSTDEQKHAETVNITVNHKSGLQFVINTVFYPEYSAFDWTVYMTNTGDANSPIVSEFYGCRNFEFEGDNPTVVGNYGEDYDVCAPYTTRVTELSEGQSFTSSPNHGRSTDGGFPYYNFEYGNKGALIAVGWSSTWETDFTYNNGVTDFYARQKTFNSYLKPGEVARTPLTAMVLYDGRDRQRAQNLWRDWFIDCNMNRDDGETLTDPFVAGVSSRQNTEMLGATEQNQIDYINKYKNMGIDISVWWMDAGWYPCNGDWVSTGNWTPDTTRFPTGFADVSETAKAQDVKTLLWFEPERVGLSKQALAELNKSGDTAVKPEWLIGYGEGNEAVFLNQPSKYAQFDMGNPEALAWLKERVKTVLENGGISIYREDCNIEQMARNYDTLALMYPDRAGITENKCVQGHYDYWDYLINLDSIELLDSCASGGHRLDLESVRYAVALHPCDYCYDDMRAKQVANYNLCSWIPFAGANTANDNVVDEYTIRSAYRQALILQYPALTMSNASFDRLKGFVDDWKTVSQYYYDDIYQLTQESYSPNSWYAYSYVNSESNKGFAMIYSRNGENTVLTDKIKLKGINADYTYKITFADSDATYTLSGKELLYKGVDVKMQGTNDSEIMYFEPTETVARDEAALDAQITKAESTKLNVYSQATTFALYQALYQAKAVKAMGSDASDDQVNAAAANLKKAVTSLKPASASTSKEQLVAGLETVIDSIGAVTEENFELKNILITYAEKLKEILVGKFPDAVASNDAILAEARAKYDEFAKGDVLYGDVNADGVVNVTDALLTLQASVGKIAFTDEQTKAGDVNGDSAVNVTDALLILQRAVNKINKFPVEG